jgi:Zn-dependent protease with chaperone function
VQLSAPAGAETVGAGSLSQGSGAVMPTQAGQELKVTQYTLSPNQMKRAEALYHTHVLMYVLQTAYSLLLLGLILRFRIAARYRDWAERATGIRFLQAWIFIPLFMISIAVAELPVGLYGQYIALRYGLSVQTFGSWFWDFGKELFLEVVLGTFVLWILYAFIRKSPRHFWFYFWLISLPILVFLIFLTPLVIEPMFNKFEPLADTHPQLVSALKQVMHRGGLELPSSRMFEMKASEKVTTYNAYVTGISTSKRVVVWDNTARDMTVPETLFVFGHEMGHYALNHVLKGLAFGAALSFIGLWLGRRLALAALARFSGRWGIRDLGDWASLPLLYLVLSVMSFFAAPMESAFSRHLEHEADIYGLEVIHGIVANSSEVAASAFQMLGEKSFSYPYPAKLYVFWTFSHPPIADRVRFALGFCPWDKGEAPQFVK